MGLVQARLAFMIMQCSATMSFEHVHVDAIDMTPSVGVPTAICRDACRTAAASCYCNIMMGNSRCCGYFCEC